MKGGQTPIHIQRWAPADLHQDEHWKLLQAKRDYRTLHFYRVFLDHAFMAGGDLPRNPAQLAAVLLMPARDVEAALRFCLGKLVFEDGDRLYQKRVRREVKKELKFRKRQSDIGKKGGRPRKDGTAKGELKGTLSDPESPPSPYAVRRSPTPAPAPTPSPAPTPTPDIPAGAAERAGGGRSNSRPPAPPASAPKGDLLDHDPGHPVEVRLASRIAHLTALVRRRDGAAEPLDVLVAVSSTEEGTHLDHIRGAPDKWLEPTLRACDRFETDNFGGDEPPLEES